MNFSMNFVGMYAQFLFIYWCLLLSLRLLQKGEVHQFWNSSFEIQFWNFVFITLSSFFYILFKWSFTLKLEMKEASMNTTPLPYICLFTFDP